MPPSTPASWTQLGLERGAFLDPASPYPAANSVFIRGYVTEASGYQSLDDEPDEAFELDVTQLHLDAATLEPLSPGDWVYFLGEAKDADGHDLDEPVLWRPVYVAAVRHPIVTSVSNLAVPVDYVPRSELDPPLWQAVRLRAEDGLGVAADVQADLLQLFWP